MTINCNILFLYFMESTLIAGSKLKFSDSVGMWCHSGFAWPHGVCRLAEMQIDKENFWHQDLVSFSKSILM